MLGRFCLADGTSFFVCFAVTLQAHGSRIDEAEPARCAVC